VSAGDYRPSENKATLKTEDVDPRLEVAPGDILLSRKNTLDLVGASAYVWDTPPHRLLPDLIFRLVPAADAPVLPVYLQAALAQPAARSAIRRLAGGSAGSMPNISKGRLLTVRLDLPHLKLQEEYARRVALVNLGRDQAGKQIAEINRLGASLQQRAFAGEL
jgi:type I restriction enzyme S subunit